MVRFYAIILVFFGLNTTLAQVQITNYEGDTTNIPTPKFIGKSDNKAYFTHFTPETEYEIWFTNGTMEGTKPLKGFDSNVYILGLNKFTNRGHSVYFAGNYEIWNYNEESLELDSVSINFRGGEELVELRTINSQVYILSQYQGVYSLYKIGDNNKTGLVQEGIFNYFITDSGELLYTFQNENDEYEIVNFNTNQLLFQEKELYSIEYEKRENIEYYVLTKTQKYTSELVYRSSPNLEWKRLSINYKSRHIPFFIEQKDTQGLILTVDKVTYPDSIFVYEFDGEEVKFSKSIYAKGLNSHYAFESSPSFLSPYVLEGDSLFFANARQFVGVDGFFHFIDLKNDTFQIKRLARVIHDYHSPEFWGLEKIGIDSFRMQSYCSSVDYNFADNTLSAFIECLDFPNPIKDKNLPKEVVLNQTKLTFDTKLWAVNGIDTIRSLLPERVIYNNWVSDNYNRINKGNAFYILRRKPYSLSVYVLEKFVDGELAISKEFNVLPGLNIDTTKYTQSHFYIRGQKSFFRVAFVDLEIQEVNLTPSENFYSFELIGEKEFYFNGNKALLYDPSTSNMTPLPLDTLKWYTFRILGDQLFASTRDENNNALIAHYKNGRFVEVEGLVYDTDYTKIIGDKLYFTNTKVGIGRFLYSITKDGVYKVEGLSNSYDFSPIDSLSILLTTNKDRVFLMNMYTGKEVWSSRNPIDRNLQFKFRSGNNLVFSRPGDGKVQDETVLFDGVRFRNYPNTIPHKLACGILLVSYNVNGINGFKELRYLPYDTKEAKLIHSGISNYFELKIKDSLKVVYFLETKNFVENYSFFYWTEGNDIAEFVDSKYDIGKFDIDLFEDAIVRYFGSKLFVCKYDFKTSSLNSFIIENYKIEPAEQRGNYILQNIIDADLYLVSSNGGVKVGQIPKAFRVVDHKDLWQVGSFLYTYSFSYSLGYQIWKFDISSKVTEQALSAFEDKLIEDDIILFPNPTTSSISITSREFDTYQVYSVRGDVLLSGKLKAYSEIIVKELSSGIYFLKLSNRTTSKVKRFVKL